MILNLNTSTFGLYGTILIDSFEADCITNKINNRSTLKISAKDKTLHHLTRLLESDILIDISDIRGIALLCVSTTPNVEDIQVFLLDKSIKLNSNIYFNIIPFYGDCSYTIAYTSNSEKKEIINLKKSLFPLEIYPKINIDKIHTLFHQKKEEGFSFAGESHDFLELTYVDSGYIYTAVENKTFTLNKGEMIIYNKNQFHSQWTDSNVIASFITITFDMNLKEIESIADRVLYIHSDLIELLMKILDEYNNNTHYSNDLILCYLKELIIKIFRNEQLENTIYNMDNRLQSSIENSIVNQSISYIHNNVDKKLTVPQIAESIPISPSYLSSIFKKHTDLTIIDYINNYKLNKSKELLMNSDHSITEISYMLGFTSVHYFSRQFKKAFGISPSKFNTK